MIKTQNDRIEALDSLRGIAALAVLVFHVKYIHKFPIDRISDHIVSKFGLGVPLFFTLSAFSIFYSLQNKPFSVQDIQHYSIRRFFRIAPLYYFLVIVYFFYRHESIFSVIYVSEFILNVTFAFGLSPESHEGLVPAGWSIGIEFLIYLVLPVLFCLIRNFKAATISFLIICVVSLILAYEFNTVSYPGKSYSYKNISLMLPFFFLGILIYQIFINPKLKNFIETKKYLLIALSLLGVFLIYGVYYCQIHYNSIAGVISKTKFYVYISIFCFFFVSLLQLSNPIKLLHNKFFNYAGKWSYSVYLVHPFIIFSSKPIYNLIYSQLSNDTVSYLLCVFYTLVVVLGLSYLSYTYIETTGINYGKKIIDRLKSKSLNA